MDFDKGELLEKLKELNQFLSQISQFSTEESLHFKKSNQKIDLRMKLNNTKSLQYLKKKDTIPNIPQNELLDILSEHIQIHHLKFILVQEFIEDIYTRFENLGSSIQELTKPLINDLQNIDQKSLEK